MPSTTIQLDVGVRDRLRSFGTAGMTYNDILQRVLDQVERDRFVAQIEKEAQAANQTGDWVDLADFDWTT